MQLVRTGALPVSAVRRNLGRRAREGSRPRMGWRVIFENKWSPAAVLSTPTGSKTTFAKTKEKKIVR